MLDKKICKRCLRSRWKLGILSVRLCQNDTFQVCFFSKLYKRERETYIKWNKDLGLMPVYQDGKSYRDSHCEDCPFELEHLMMGQKNAV